MAALREMSHSLPLKLFINKINELQLIYSKTLKIAGAF